MTQTWGVGKNGAQDWGGVQTTYLCDTCSGIDTERFLHWPIGVNMQARYEGEGRTG